MPIGKTKSNWYAVRSVVLLVRLIAKLVVLPEPTAISATEITSSSVGTGSGSGSGSGSELEPSVCKTG